MALRVAAKTTADGIDYGMGFDDPAPGDEMTVFDGLTVLIAAPSRPWLESTVLDFVQLDAGQHDFIFVPAPKSAPQGATAPARSCGSGGCPGCR
jgi:Fe-S cluster assembly iron-binding protein IscA